MWNVIARLILPALAYVTFLVLYKFIPNTSVKLSNVWAGALLASLAFDFANLCFVWYVQNYGHYNLLYGSVGDHPGNSNLGVPVRHHPTLGSLGHFPLQRICGEPS